MDKVICQNCGASIYENEPACPFCGFINMEGAEDKFMRDVQKKEEELTQIPELQKQDLKKSVSKSSKIIIITVLIAATILAVLFGLHYAFEAMLFSEDNYDAKTEMLWERENYPVLDKMYEERDWEGLLKFEEELYEINDKEGTNHTIYNWEHSDFLYAYRRFENVKYYVSILDSGESLSKFQAENIVYYCMWFHYRMYVNDYQTFTEEEVAMVDEYREYTDEVFYNRLKFTDTEADELYEKAEEYHSIDAKTCYSYARKIRKRFE